MFMRKYCLSQTFRVWRSYRGQCRRSFSTNSTATPSEPAEADRKELILWQLKLSACLAGTAISIYGAYVVISSGFQLERIKRKLNSNWNRLLYGNTLPSNVEAFLNSRFNACLSPELLKHLSTYFIKFDMVKDNGVRRRDVILFLESIGVSTENAFVERFIAAGLGDTKENRLVSGCSLQEFTDLLEVLVLEDRLNGDSQLEERIIKKFKDYNADADMDSYLTNKEFHLGNPLLSGAAKKLSKELSKYIKKDVEVAQRQDLQDELNRNYRLRDKLKQLSSTRKLSEQEKRRLNNVNNEIELLEEEISKQKHTSNLLWFM